MEVDEAVDRRPTQHEACKHSSTAPHACCCVCSTLDCQNRWKKKHERKLQTRVHSSIVGEDAFGVEADGENWLQASIADCKIAGDFQRAPMQVDSNRNSAVGDACNGFGTSKAKRVQVFVRGKEMEEHPVRASSPSWSSHTPNQTKSIVPCSDAADEGAIELAQLEVQLERIQKLEEATGECYKEARDAMTEERQIQIRAEHLLTQISETSLDQSENSGLQPVKTKCVSVSSEVQQTLCCADTAQLHQHMKQSPKPSRLVTRTETSYGNNFSSYSNQESNHSRKAAHGNVTMKQKPNFERMASSSKEKIPSLPLYIQHKDKCEHLTAKKIEGGFIDNSSFGLHPVCDYSALKNTFQMFTDQVQCPRCLAFSDNSDVFLVCHCGESVRVFGEPWKFKWRVGRQGSGDSEFMNPYGLAIRDKTMYVSDSGNHRIQIFTTDGHFLGKFGCRGSGSTQFAHPYGVGVSQHGSVYVADYGNNRVQIFNPDGNFLHAISGNHWRKGVFRSPYSLAIGPHGEIHVTGYASSNVTIFGPNGEFVRSYDLPNPKGIAVDNSGYSLVSSYGTLSVIDPFSKTRGEIKGTGSGEAIAIAPDGFVWISDHNNQVLKY